jgi:lipoic acid synthetase
MLGLGETADEVREAMARLRDAGVDVLTLGQYLRPTPKHAPIDRYVHPDEFEAHRVAGEALGFRFVASGPLVRSSYRAAEVFLHGLLGDRDPTADRYGKRRHLPVLEA